MSRADEFLEYDTAEYWYERFFEEAEKWAEELEFEEEEE